MINLNKTAFLIVLLFAACSTLVLAEEDGSLEDRIRAAEVEQEKIDKYITKIERQVQILY